MMGYLKVGVLLFFSILSIYFYYFVYSFHVESKVGMIAYVLVIGTMYGLYKLFQLSFYQKKVQYAPIHIIIFFLIHLFVLCCMYFGYKGMSPLLGSVLFLKITWFLALISLLWIFIYNLGRTILEYILKNRGVEDSSLSILTSLGLGFFIFMLGVFLLAVGGMYTKLHILLWIICIGAVGYKHNIALIKSSKLPFTEYDLTDATEKTRLFINEIHLLVVSLLLSVNFVNIFRPFPIGWDDLGVYMNYPKLLAQAGEIIPLGQMQTWQLYTGIGHVFENQTFAFFLNSFSGVIVALAVYFAIKGILEKKSYSLLSIPLLSVMIILMMPMAVFQLAKDMKLDYGLFAMSIPAIYVVYYLFFKAKNISATTHSILICIAGVLIGVALSIKITSLLLCMGVLGMIFYKRLSFFGFLVFIGALIGSFTGLGIWSMMNVVMPEGSQNVIYLSALLISMVGIIGLYFWEERREVQAYILTGRDTLLLLLGLFLTLSPWMAYNFSTHGGQQGFSITQLISSDSNVYSPDFTKIYTPEELGKIERQRTSGRGIDETGTTTNADFGRYFGYEGGINNYLKLPWNLSYQVNQKGEFTDISYLFFALFPAMLLFLPYKKEKYVFVPIGGFVVLLLYYIPGPVSRFITEYLSYVQLPLGYIFILLFFLCPFAFFHYSLDKSKKISQLFLLTYAFLTTYVFLWNISAFGIVWYGIVMYFAFLLVIGIGMISASKQEGGYAQYVSYIVLATVWVYVFSSAIPHAIKNHKSNTHDTYKLGHLSQEEAVFLSHPEYFKILHTLNIRSEKYEALFIEYRNSLLEIIDEISGQEELLSYIQSTKNIEQIRLIMNELLKQDIGVSDEPIRNLRQQLFEEVLYVDDENKNTHKVYRIGTFLKYFVSENVSRFYGDSLIDKFDTYIYDDDLDVPLERMKQLDMPYLLVDLNAATIDKDPRKQLTQRYENLLKFMSHEDITLVETDSPCLKLGLDEYRGHKDIERYLEIAGVNYGSAQEKNSKKLACLIRISELIQDDKITNETYPYLMRIKNSYLQAIKTMQENGEEITPEKLTYTLNARVPHGYKALFEIQ